MNSGNSPRQHVDRRTAIGMGGGAVLLAAFGSGRRLSAQEGTPTAAQDINGHIGVTRRYVVAEGANVSELIEKVVGFVDIISSTAGFTAYVITFDEATRIWSSLTLFDNADSATASTAAAADYVQANDLGSYFENPTPEVVEGSVVVNAGF